MAVTRSDIDSIMRGITEPLMQHMRDTVHHCILQELGDVHRRLHLIEQKAMRYCGVYQRAQVYMKGDSVTASGALWYATRDDLSEIPGSGQGWQLINKSHA